MKKILKNATSSDISIGDTGVSILGNSTYVIPPQDHLLWIASEDIIPQILIGNVIVNDGDSDLSAKVAIGLIKDNQPILNDYYTLAEEDDILIGNGQILQLHEDNWELDDIGEVDDNPTEI